MLPMDNPVSPASSSHVDSFPEPSSRSRGLTIKLHPAVVMNFFHHHTRLNACAACNGISCSERVTSAQQPRMFGCVIGVRRQRGQTVEIFNSFELVLDPVSGTLDPDFLKNMQEQSKKVYPDFDVLGWYSIGSAVQDSDIQIHKAFMGFDKCPVYLLLHPTFDLSQKDLPATIYECDSRVMNGRVELHFVNSNYIIEIVEADKISADFSLSRPASTAESDEQDNLATSEIGLESNDREENKPYSKVLFETPSGFAMFDVSDWVLIDPEEIWIWFTRINSAKKAVYTLGFVKVDKSVARDSDVGPGKDLEAFILKFCNGKQLIVPDLQIKAVIEGKLKVKCFCEKEIVHELTWGLNYALAAFVPEEKGYPINERPLSKYLERKIKTRLVNASLQKIDREFIDMLGFLVSQELVSVTIPTFLHSIFDLYIHVTQNMNDEKFVEEVEALLSSPRPQWQKFLKIAIIAKKT